MKRVLELTLRLADGTATEAECRELEKLVESDRHARRLYLEMMEIEAALRSSTAAVDMDSLAEERTVHGVLASIRLSSLSRRSPPRRMGSRPIWIAAGLVAVVATVAVLLMPAMLRKRAPASGGAQVFARSRPARLDPLPLRPLAGAGAWTAAPMRVRPLGPAALSRLELDEGVVLEVRGQGLVRGIERAAAGDGVGRIAVGEGTFAVEGTNPGLPAVLVVTPHAEVVTRAQRTLVVVSGDGTRVDLHDGTAAVKRLRDGAAVALTARQGLMVTGEPRDEPRSARPLPAVLFIKGQQSGRHPTDFLDGNLVRHIEGLGFAVEVVDEVELTAGHLGGKALMMISPSASEPMVDRIEELGLASWRMPIVCSRPSLFGSLDMTTPGAREAGFATNATRVEILAPSHALSGGYTGPVQVTLAPGRIGWAQPGPGADRIASFPDARKSDQASIFAYERGVPMVGNAQAPARRVGFFLHPDVGPYITDAGWALLDAAIRWAADDQSP
jgi:hypothetical protein